ncbi:MAG: HrcA family transcriptional regulator [Microgenomates group bacterium]
MTPLTERQIRILKALVEEYIETGEPVGSEILEKKYDLGVSPATIRNEMAKLTEAGFLRQPHTSAGRVPTKEAFKFYVDKLMEEKQLSVAEEVTAKEKVWDSRFDFDNFLDEIVKTLASQTQTLSLAVVEGGKVYHSGYANILNQPEFYDIDVTRTVLSLLDEEEEIRKIFSRCFGEGPIHLLIGDELGYKFLEPCGLVFANFDAGENRRGSLGVFGPNRLNYSQIIPFVRYFVKLIEELGRV